MNLEDYLSRLTRGLQETFGSRLCYLGLQGSFLRGEATPDSDIDVMAVIENLSPEDLALYRWILEETGDFDRSCGFLCGKEELANWNPLEICHLLHTTKDLYGELALLVPGYTRENVRDYILLSLGNLYHELVHRRVHRGEERTRERLPVAIRQIFFILQNLHYLETGVFPTTKAELLDVLPREEDRAVLALSMKPREDPAFEGAFPLVFGWCQRALKRTALL